MEHFMHFLFIFLEKMKLQDFLKILPNKMPSNDTIDLDSGI